MSMMLDDERLCRLCGSPYLPEDRNQLFCSDECEVKDRKIDEAEFRRESDCDRIGIPKSQSPRG